MKVLIRLLFFSLCFFFSGLHAEWAEHTIKNLSLDEKIGQLIMAATYSSDAGNHIQYIEDLISAYHIGSLLFFQGEPEDKRKSDEINFFNCRRKQGEPHAQAALTNHYQKLSTLPLLIAQDNECGLYSRLKNVMRFPVAMTLGAIHDDNLIYAVGKKIGQQCRALGVHINFAPVVDVNTNPQNPIIGIRSFGDDKYRVAAKASTFARGLQDGGVLGCAKHFPGHGDTLLDSHKDLPLIPHNTARLHNEELYPFKALIEAGVTSIMTGHLEIPALDNTPNLSSSLSKKIVTDLLQHDLGFSGLIVSDALVMGAITKHYEPGEAAVLAFLAGNDLLVFPPDIAGAIEGIKQAVIEGRISEQELDRRVLKVLCIKESLGLHKIRSINEDTLQASLNSEEAYELKQALYRAAVTLVRDEQNLLSSSLNPAQCAYLEIEGREVHYSPQDTGLSLQLPRLFTDHDIEEAIRKVGNFDIVILTAYALDATTRFYQAIKKIDSRMIALLEALHGANKKVIVLACMNPYCLKFLDQEKTIIMAYEDDQEAVDAALAVVFGTLKPQGSLPICS